MDTAYSYKTYTIRYNAINPDTANFSAFGWAFAVVRSNQQNDPRRDEKVFEAVVKSAVHEDNHYKEIAKRQLQQFVENLIDNESFENIKYCFTWGNNEKALEKISCSEIDS